MSATAAIATPHDNFIDLKITQSEFTRCKALGFAFWELVSQSAIGHSESEVSCGTACLPTRSSKRRTKSDKISTHAISGASMNGDEFPLSLPTSLFLTHSRPHRRKRQIICQTRSDRKEMRSKFAFASPCRRQSLNVWRSHFSLVVFRSVNKEKRPS